MKPIKYSLTKQIADQIEQDISIGKYAIGDKIPTEPELCALFGVSRNTIREAMQSLIHAGILEARQGDGTYVIAKERLQVVFFDLMHKTTKLEINEVRNLLETHIVLSATQNATQEDIASMEYHLNRRNNSSDTVKENTDNDILFHQSIAIATHNNLLIHMYQYVSQYFIAFILEKFENTQSDYSYIDGLHNDLFLAIKNKDTIIAQKTIEKILTL